MDQLSFRYEGATQDTLKGLDLEIADGEAHALLGASGSGKTTLLNLLSVSARPRAVRYVSTGSTCPHNVAGTRCCPGVSVSGAL